MDGGLDEAKGFDETKYALRAHERNLEAVSGARKTAVESANVAIRALILVNGGAVVALLAFISSLETGNSGAVNLDALASPLHWFAYGVGLSAATATLAYLINMCDADIFASVTYSWEHPYVTERPLAKRLRAWRTVLHILALALAASSLIAFFCGIFSVTDAISKLGI